MPKLFGGHLNYLVKLPVSWLIGCIFISMHLITSSCSFAIYIAHGRTLLVNIQLLQFKAVTFTESSCFINTSILKLMDSPVLIGLPIREGQDVDSVMEGIILTTFPSLT